MTLNDRFNYFVANNLYWVQLAVSVYFPFLTGFFN